MLPDVFDPEEHENSTLHLRIKATYTNGQDMRLMLELKGPSPLV